MAVPYHEASSTTRSPHSPLPSRSNSKWGPYSSAGDFGANIVVILVVLLCALVFALALNAAIRYLLCSDSRRRRRVGEDPEKDPGSKGASAVPKSEVGPTLVYSATEGTKLAGGEAQCAICLAEFLDGELVRVLAACGHGFHDACIDLWLGAGVRRSCPTCRSSCHRAVGSAGNSGVEGV